jgi:hypothetical protein
VAVDSFDTSHRLSFPGLALPLLVPRVRADHPDPAAPADDLAPIADLLHRGPDLHLSPPVILVTGSGT